MFENFLSAEGGHGKGFWDADQVLFLNLSGPWQTSLNAIFLIQVPKSCFYKAVPFLKILQWLTSLTQNKIKSSYHGLQGLKHLAPPTFCPPVTQDTWSRLLLQGHSAHWVFSLENSPSGCPMTTPLNVIQMSVQMSAFQRCLPITAIFLPFYFSLCHLAQSDKCYINV